MTTYPARNGNGPAQGELFFMPEQEVHRQCVVKITIPVYGMKEHVDKTVAEVERVLALSFGDIRVEQCHE